MNTNLYFSVGIIGVVISLLEYLIAKDVAMAYSFVFLTATLLMLMYLYSEWNYYRSHNAVLATSEFLLIPSVLIITGNILSPKSADGTIIDLQLTSLQINASSTITSSLLVIPILIFGNLIVKYYKGQYSGFVVRRKIHDRLKYPLSIHFLLIFGLIYSSTITGIYDFVSLIFIIWSVFIIFRHVILPKIQQKRSEQISQERRRYVSTMLSTAPRVSRRTLRDRSPSSSRTSIPTQPRGGIRSVNTRPSDGYREIVPNGRPNVQSQSNLQNTRRSSEIANIERGIVMHKPSKIAKKISSKSIKKYLPSGNITKDDLRCMVCYQKFNGNPKSNVKICPYCKFPAHELELLEWLSSSNMCPRCSKDIKNNGKIFLKISEKQYTNIIKKL